MCNCDVCTDTRDLRDQGVPEAVIDRLLQAEFDINYYEAILDGSWPTSRAILEAALRKLDDL